MCAKASLAVKLLVAGVRDRELARAAQLSDASLRIAGFGACMISGYPHASRGLFEVACRFVEDALRLSVQSNIVSLGGFPAPRAAKYLKRKIFSFNPDYVVIQFGATDASSSIRRTFGDGKSNGTPRSAVNHNHPATVLSLFRWQMASVLGFILKPQPITALSEYIAATGDMVKDCTSAGITAVVLSPFVFGSRYATRNAILYADALHELHSKNENVLLVDCNGLLRKFPRARILLSDGFHLSALGHELIGEAIGEAIVLDIRARNTSAPLGAKVTLALDSSNAASGSAGSNWRLASASPSATAW